MAATVRLTVLPEIAQCLGDFDLCYVWETHKETLQNPTV
jgi:hypothetical protein